MLILIIWFAIATFYFNFPCYFIVFLKPLEEKQINAHGYIINWYREG